MVSSKTKMVAGLHPKPKTQCLQSTAMAGQSCLGQGEGITSSTWDVLHFSIKTRKCSPQQQPTEDESKNKETVHTRRVEASPLKCLLMLMHCNETQHNLLHEIPKVNKNQEHKLISPQRSRTPTAFSLPYHISFFFLMSSAKLPSNTFMNSSPQ